MLRYVLYPLSSPVRFTYLSRIKDTVDALIVPGGAKGADTLSRPKLARLLLVLS